MEYLDQTFFSETQTWIVKKKLKGYSYSAIKGKYKEKDDFIGTISDEAIKTCLKRSSLSLTWEKGQIAGNIPLLSEVDVFKLKDYVLETSIDGTYLDVNDTIEKANYLRKERFSNAHSFLIKIRCYNIIEELREEFNKHDAGRDWVYQHIEELEADLSTPRNIEVNRLVACTPEKIQLYTRTLFPFLEQIHPSLRFTADETMLQPSVNRKVLVPNNHSKPLLPNDMTLPHITAMCCCNVVGDKFPLFIILNSLVKIPPDLKSFQETGEAVFSSSPSGWQTRDTFLYWVICFVNWLSLHRLKLDPTIRNSKAILIMDGHKSRENPVAIKILKDHNVEVFIIPAHTSHLTQLFDVIIASPMKSCFSDLLKKMMNDFNIEENNTAQLRFFCVKAALISWDMKANKKACMIGSRLTGLNPIDDGELMSSNFVAKLTPEITKYIKKKKKDIAREELNINCKFISDIENMKTINEFILCSKFHKHLSLLNYSGNYICNVPSFCSRVINDCRFFGQIPCYYDISTSKIHFF